MSSARPTYRNAGQPSSRATTTASAFASEEDQSFNDTDSVGDEDYGSEEEDHTRPDDPTSVSSASRYPGPSRRNTRQGLPFRPSTTVSSQIPPRPGPAPNHTESLDTHEDYQQPFQPYPRTGYNRAPRTHSFYGANGGHPPAGYTQNHVAGYTPSMYGQPPNQMVPYGGYPPNNPFASMPHGSGQTFFQDPRHDLIQYQHSQPPALYNQQAYGQVHQWQMYPSASQHPPADGAGPSKTPANEPAPPPKEDPEKIKLQQELELFKKMQAEKEEEQRRKELEEKYRKEAEEAAARRMEDLRRAQELAQKEIEKAKQEAEQAARERIEAERKEEEQRRKLHQEEMARVEREARERLEREHKAEAERKKLEEEARLKAQAEATQRLKEALQAEAELRAKEAKEAEAKRKWEEDLKKKVEQEARAKMEAEKKAAAEAAAKQTKLEADLKAKAEAEYLAKVEAAKQAAEKEAAEARRRAEEAKMKAEAEFAAAQKAAADAAAAKKKEEEEMKARAEFEARAKLEAEKKAAEAAAAAEAAKKKETDELKKKIAEEARAKYDAEKNKAKDKPPIKFKDAVGRKFSFPFHLCATWTGMEELIKQAFVHVDIIGPHVQEGHYDLIGPNGEIILPQVWDKVVEPDWTIEMRMWPMDQAPPPGMHPGMPMDPRRHSRMGPTPQGFAPPNFRPSGGGPNPPVPPPPPGFPPANHQSTRHGVPPTHGHHHHHHHQVKSKHKPKGQDAVLNWISGVGKAQKKKTKK